MKRCVARYDPVKAEKNEICLVSFANGLINCNSNSTVKFGCYENTCTSDGLQRKKSRKIVAADTGKLQYVGFNFGPDASRSSGLCRFYVGFLNTRRKKMRIVNAQHYKLQPIFETYADKEEEKEKSFIEKIDLLTGAFGSKKKRRAMEARHKYSLQSKDVEEATKYAVAEGKETFLQNANVFDGETVNESQPEAIPPQNKDATKPADVYNIFDIIPQEEYDALHETASTFTSASLSDINTWKEEETFPKYVLDRIQPKAHKKGVSGDTAIKLCYFVFLTYLLQLKAKEVRKKDALSSVPAPFNKSLLEKFTMTHCSESGQKQRSFPQRLKDKAIANLLILALFLDDFNISLSEIQKSVKLPMTKLRSISSALGCHVRSQKSSNKELLHHAELKIPLAVKKSTIPRARKRK